VSHNKRKVIVGWSCVCDEEWYDEVGAGQLIDEIYEMCDALERRVRAGKTTAKVLDFVRSAHHFAESIERWRIHDFDSRRQRAALKRFHCGLLRWFEWSEEGVYQYQYQQIVICSRVVDELERLNPRPKRWEVYPIVYSELEKSGYAVGADAIKWRVDDYVLNHWSV